MPFSVTRYFISWLTTIEEQNRFSNHLKVMKHRLKTTHNMYRAPVTFSEGPKSTLEEQIIC